MRNLTLGPVALSLALHASVAALALTTTFPSAAPPSVPADLTIGLALLPTAQEPSAPAQPSSTSTDAADLPAVKDDAVPASVKTILPDDAQAGKAITEAPQALPQTLPGANLLPAQDVAVPTSNDVSARPLPESAASEARPIETDTAAVAVEPPPSPLSMPPDQALTDGQVPSQAREPPVPEQTASAVDVPAVAPELAPTARLTTGANDVPVAAPTADSSLSAVAEAAPTTVARIEDVPSSSPPVAAREESAAKVASITAVPVEPDAVRTEDVEDDPVSADALRRAQAFIARYDGGPCVFLSAVHADREAVAIDGFAVSSDPFSVFHQGFTAATGFEPFVTGQKIWKPQCPAVDFLRRIRGQRADPLVLQLNPVTVKGGASLHGVIHDPVHRLLHLFSVSEAGAVVDVTELLRSAGEDFTFTMVTGHGEAGVRPQLLIVLAGDTAALASAAAGQTASSFFRGLDEDAGRRPGALAAAAKLYLLSD